MRALRTTLLCVTMFAFAGLFACSSDDSSSGAADEPPVTDAELDDGTGEGQADVERIEPVDGPEPEVTGPLSAGGGVLLLAAVPPDLPDDWVEEEYRLSGSAVHYRAEGDLPADGLFELTEGESADYATRVVVRRPGNPADFNGTVVVEWFNVSSGSDAAPDYTYLRDEFVRSGYAWVGVSAQHIGVEGGPVAVSSELTEIAGAGRGLKGMDPDRYGDLAHPGDAFSYDIFTQVGRAVRADDGPLMDDLASSVDKVIAAGESQSAFALTTYVNGVQPLTRQFDGFFIHSRGGAAAALGEPGEAIAIADAIGQQPTVIRTDGLAPILVVQTEGDILGLLNYHPARQDDDDRLRLWEIAGSAHVDVYQLGVAADLLECPAPLNNGPQHFVLKAGLSHLNSWIDGGEPPPEAPRITVEEGDPAAFVRDEFGIVEGGIRTPVVDVPVDVLSGDPVEGGSVMCLLFGSTQPIPADDLAERYESADSYLDEYSEAAQAAVDSGFVLEDDLDALLEWAEPDRIAG